MVSKQYYWVIVLLCLETSQEPSGEVSESRKRSEFNLISTVLTGPPEVNDIWGKKLYNSGNVKLPRHTSSLASLVTTYQLPEWVITTTNSKRNQTNTTEMVEQTAIKYARQYLISIAPWHRQKIIWWLRIVVNFYFHHDHRKKRFTGILYYTPNVK